MEESTPLASLNFREAYLEVDGFQVKYREAGQGNPVVLLDGMPWGNSQLREALVQNYRVVDLELPGFGASPANTRSTSVRELAETTAQAVASIVPGNYTLVGTSFGANVALWQTLLAPERVEALVLVSPTAVLPRASLAAGDQTDMAGQLLAHPENLSGLGEVAPDVLAKELALIQRLGGGVQDAELESRLGEIQCATLVVFGSQDRLVASEAASIYRRDIPNCNVSIVYDAGHLIVAERPKALIDAVVDYVERRETFVVSREDRVISP